MQSFIINNQELLINTGITIVIFIIIRFIGKLAIKKIGQKSTINNARIALISRYYTVSLLLIFLFIEAYILGVDIEE